MFRVKNRVNIIVSALSPFYGLVRRWSLCALPLHFFGASDLSSLDRVVMCFWGCVQIVASPHSKHSFVI